MSNKPRSKPQLFTVGKTHYVSVDSADAFALHSQLRAQGITSSPPEPYQGNTDSIQLSKGSNLENVQALLDRWA